MNKHGRGYVMKKSWSCKTCTSLCVYRWVVWPVCQRVRSCECCEVLCLLWGSMCVCIDGSSWQYVNMWDPVNVLWGTVCVVRTCECVVRSCVCIDGYSWQCVNMWGPVNVLWGPLCVVRSCECVVRSCVCCEVLWMCCEVLCLLWGPMCVCVDGYSWQCVNVWGPVSDRRCSCLYSST